MDEQTNIPILLVTANVGSIFEDVSVYLLYEFLPLQIAPK